MNVSVRCFRVWYVMHTFICFRINRVVPSLNETFVLLGFDFPTMFLFCTLPKAIVLLPEENPSICKTPHHNCSALLSKQVAKDRLCPAENSPLRTRIDHEVFHNPFMLQSAKADTCKSLGLQSASKTLSPAAKFKIRTASV